MGCRSTLPVFPKPLHSLREMLETQILQPVNGGNKPSDQQSGGFTDENGTEVKRPSKVVKPGPTGKIEPEENP